MKGVKYFKNAMMVPSWVTHIAIDENGEVYGYDDVPQFLPSFTRRLGCWLPTGDQFVLLATVKGEQEFYPVDTLKEV